MLRYFLSKLSNLSNAKLVIFIALITTTLLIQAKEDTEENKKINNKSPVIDAYVSLVGPDNLNSVRVNLENSYDTDGKITRTEIDFGDGTIMSNKAEVLHTYTSNQIYKIKIRAWDNKNAVSEFSQEIDINTNYQYLDAAKPSIFGPIELVKNKDNFITLSRQNASKLYKVILIKNNSNERSLKKYKDKWWHHHYEEDTAIELNNIRLFTKKEIDEDADNYIEKFIQLKEKNVISSHYKKRENQKIILEIREIDILKDTTAPVVSFDLSSDVLTNRSNVTVTISDASSVTTNIWKNNTFVFSTDLTVFSIQLDEGINNYIFQSSDFYNNISIPYKLSNVFVDRFPPSAIEVSPSTSETIFTNTNPFNFSYKIQYNELLSSAYIKGAISSFDGLKTLTADLQITASEQFSMTSIATDFAGNTSITTKDYHVVIDTTPPVLTISDLPSLTNKNYVTLNYLSEDENFLKSEVYVDNQILYTGYNTTENINLPLTSDGTHQIKIIAYDKAGNTTTSNPIATTTDTSPPQLLSISPSNGQTFSKIAFLIQGASNEQLSRVKINGSEASINSDQKTFSLNYVSDHLGENSLNIELIDLVGNLANYNVIFNISSPLIISSLISVLPNPSEPNRYDIVGLQGAARAGAEINISEGIFSFNRGSDVVKEDGLFKVTLNKFQKVTLKANDSRIGDSATLDILFNIPTSLTGILKDINDTPIANATVKILGSNATAVSNENGVFTINNCPIGDQIISIDASTSLQPTGQTQRKYSVTHISYSISAGKVNTIGKTLYLTPIILDGSGTQITSNSTNTVTDINAPDISIKVPAGTALFPDGTHSGLIQIKEIPYSKSLLAPPAAFIPEKIISLQPSGLKFSEPVEMSFPNINELNPNTEVFIMSLNSLSGSWEINGVGKVQTDGVSIKTKPGYGITHFSEIFVVPTIPLFESVQNPNLTGINVSQDSLTTLVKLPSYKVLGETITPSLKYNASWANPTAFVSNIFDIPKYEVKFNYTVNNYTNSSLQGSPYFCVANWCSSRQYKQEVYHNENYNFQSGYFVDKLSAQTWIGINSTDDENYETIQNTNSSDIPGFVLKNSLKTEPWTIQNNTDGTLIPNMSQVSFKIPLIKEDGTYLKSGIYPSFTRWRVKLKHLVITSHYLDYRIYINGDEINSATIYKNESNLKSTQIGEITPVDVNRNILVQNKVNSEFGRGWKFNGIPELLNTKGSKILLEDSTGELKTYSLSNRIETLFNANNSNIDFTNGLGFDTWPNVYVNKYGSDKIGALANLNLETGSIVNLSILPEYMGTTGFDKVDDCFPGSTDPSIKKYKFSFKYKPGMANILKLPNGRIIASSTTTHSILELTEPDGKILGGLVESTNGFNTGGSGFQQRYDTLCASLNLDCSPLVNLNQSYSCNSAIVKHDESGTIAKALTEVPISNPGSNDFSGGQINGSGFFGTDNFTALSFNSPSGLAISPDGKLVIADTGSNVVYKVNLETGKLKIEAGNYTTSDTGDDGLAAPPVIYDVVQFLEKETHFKFSYYIKLLFGNKLMAAFINTISNHGGAGIYHPKAVAYDNAGNLYISTENGFIRKVDPNGIITTYAGKSLADGGALADAIHAELMNLNNPTGVIIDNENQIMYIADTGHHRILKIDMNTKIASVIAGNGSCEINPKDGPSALNSSICAPTWLGFDNEKNLIAVDSGHNRIRRIILKSNSSNKVAYSLRLQMVPN